MWYAVMGLFGIVFWLYAVLTLVAPGTFAPYGYLMAILAGLLFIFFIVTEIIAGKESVERAWDESTEYDSNRAYRFGFNVAWIVYLVFWLLLSRGWIPVEASFPAMGAFTGGSYCLYMGISGVRSWYETRNASD